MGETWLPDDPVLREPVFAHVGEGLAGGIALAWSASDELPTMDGRGVGMLLVEIPGGAGPETPDNARVTAVESVTVRGAEAKWVEGIHEFLSPDGGTRWAASTLVWRAGDVTLRLESWLSKDRAIAIAETIT